MNADQQHISIERSSTGYIWNLGSIFRQRLEVSRSQLPSKFINSREEITPYVTFKKSEVGGGIINLQQTAIDLQTNEAMMVIIIQF